MPSSRIPGLRCLVGASAIAMVMLGTGGAHAQVARPAMPRVAPPNAPSVLAPRSLESPPLATIPPAAVWSRPGGCPEGPPCPAATPPDAGNEGEECGDEPGCPTKE